MDLSFSADEVSFREEVRSFVRDNLPVAIRDKLASGRHAGKDDFVPWTRILAGKGWSVPHWPVEWGGTGWSPLRQHIFEQESYSADAPYVNWSSTRLVAPVVLVMSS